MCSLGIEIPYPQATKQPLLFLVDVSGSMGIVDETKTTRLQRLIDGLKMFKELLLKDTTARRSIEVAVLVFGKENNEKGVELIQDFTDIERFNVPENLRAEGPTPLAYALLKAVDIVEERKKLYRSKGINYYRPWIWLITDGFPTDILSLEFIERVDKQQISPEEVCRYCGSGDKELYSKLIETLKEGIEKKKFILWPVVVGKKNEYDAIIGQQVLNKCIMEKVDPTRPALFMEDTKDKWKEMVQWLSASMSTVSRSRPGETVKLEPIGWAQVQI